MMTPLDIVKYYADTWRSLAAWGASVEMTVEVKPQPANVSKFGYARVEDGAAVVYETGDLAEDLGTVLHELAHLAAPRVTGHDAAWRTLYVRAAAEALNVPRETLDEDSAGVSIAILDVQVVAAVKQWLVHTGQLTVLTALGVLK